MSKNNWRGPGCFEGAVPVAAVESGSTPIGNLRELGGIGTGPVADGAPGREADAAVPTCDDSFELGLLSQPPV